MSYPILDSFLCRKNNGINSKRDMEESNREKLGAAKWSVYLNITLGSLKLLVGLYTGSLGILAEFIHTFFDFIASVFAYLGIKKAGEPADKTHHYGHERFENISSLLQALLIAATSIFILYEAYGRLISGNHTVNESSVGIIVMAMTLVADVKIARFLHRKSNETGSPALEADAYHFTTDIMSTLAVIVGLAATVMGFPIADILSAVFVAFVMLYISINLSKKSALIMLDEAPDNKTLEGIALLISKHPGIRGYHSLRARTSGHRIFIDVSIHLINEISLAQAHDIAEDIEARIIEEYPEVKEVVTHIEPETNHDTRTAMKRIFG